MRLEIRPHSVEPLKLSAHIYRDGVLVSLSTVLISEAQALAERFAEQGLTVSWRPFCDGEHANEDELQSKLN
ncbi:MAG: hypothetical protein H7Y22_05415 [Gemmatimonadaceae bacterium]|nr:hypothetical protein [Gloeobacterales cyanobacterium ES-bin-141]